MNHTSILYKFSALLVSLAVILLSLSGCNPKDYDEPETDISSGNEQTEEVKRLCLPYSRADSLNPFKAQTTVNRQLTNLLYDGLFTLDSNFSPICIIAQDYTVDGKTITVPLKSGIYFTNGVPVTAEDVVYSFYKASSSSVYKNSLKNISSATASGDGSVVFTLNTYDPFAVNCLTFAIVEKGTADNSDDDDVTRVNIPIGSGRYYVSSPSADKILSANRSRLGAYNPGLSEIRLVPVNDKESLSYSVEIGNIDFMFDPLSSGDYRRLNATTADVPLNNLVYLGFNPGNAALQDPAVRQAVAAAINRNAISETAFQGHANVAFTPFNPLWKPVLGYDYSSIYGTDKAEKILKDAGYTRKNDSGARYSDSKTLYFSLLVSKTSAFKLSAAKMIADDLKKVGIIVKIVEEDSETFLESVSKGEYSMFVCESSLSMNMSMKSFYSSGNSLSGTAITSSGTSFDAYSKMLSGEYDTAEFIEEFNLDVPFVPLCYRIGLVACSRNLSTSLKNTTCSDVYFNIESWNFVS